MQLMIETTGVADRLSCPRSSPQGRYLGETIGAADALATIVALETDKLIPRIFSKPDKLKISRIFSIFSPRESFSA